MARGFNGSTDKIQLGIGSTGFAFGPGTMAVVCRRVGTALSTALSAGAATPNTFDIGVQPHTGFTTPQADQISGYNGVASVAPATGMTMLEADGWCLIAYTKATGTVAPRLHKYRFATGVWEHADGSTTQANSAVPATRNTYGANAGATVFWNGDVMIGAIWNVVLSDAQVESLGQKLVYTWWQGVTTAPVAIWVLNQPDTATLVPDLSGGAGGQFGITGTTVTGDPALGFAVVGSDPSTFPKGSE